MKQSEYDDFTDIIQVIGEQYGKKLSGGVIALYWQGLQDFDLVAVRDALGRHLRNTDTGQFMPKIADIIKMLQGSTLDSALNAWAKVDKAVRRVGPYESVAFDDPIIHRVLHDMGGWISFGDKTEDELPFVAREFENRYRGFKSSGVKIEYPEKLVGINEAHNAQSIKTIGFIKPPILIGDVEKARMVIHDGTNSSKLLGISRAPDESDVINKISELRIIES